MFLKKTINDVDVQGKTVLMRADFNVPLNGAVIEDDYRIKQALPTIKYLLEKDVRLVVCSHLGRPDGKPNPAESLFPVAKELGELLGKDKVNFATGAIESAVKVEVDKLQPGQLLLLENLRFYPGEEKNDPDFAKKLVETSGAELFVQDGFGVVHRAHASTEAVTHFLPSVAGFLLAKEVDTITQVMQDPKRPLVAVIGGAKISDKIEILNKFIDIADVVAVGGAMANTFLAAQGIELGDSLVETADLTVARDIIAKAAEKSKHNDFVFYLPQDGVVAHKIDKAASTRLVDWSAHIIADIEHYPKRPPISSRTIEAHEMILDIGPFSASFVAGAIQLSGTVVWNGTMGVAETPGLQGPIGPTAHGTEIIIDAITGRDGHKPFSVVGGGDTVSYIEGRQMVDMFNHVSTGGGASLELMAGRQLPGVEALLNRDNEG
jgi:phosphoglycerate kinase